MLSIPPGAKVFLAIGNVDFRKQIPGLKKWIQNHLLLNPLSGAYFFFFSKDRKSIKIIHYDGQGICLYSKKLSSSKFKQWNGLYDASKNYTQLCSTEGQVILMNGNTRNLKIPKNWRDIS